ncbi:MAG: hypothetical protein K2Y37_09230 [Pirellulales bacterium]|nr:hypothetical protein [Pirellulales bacterium]
MASVKLLLVGIVMLAVDARADGAAAPRVQFDIVTDDGVPAEVIRDWYQVFADLQVRQADFHAPRGAQPLEIETLGRGSGYVVHGRLTRARELLIPGNRFALADRTRLAAWIERLASDGPAALADARPDAFGLPATTLDKLRQRLARPYEAATRGRSPSDVVDDLADSLSLDVIGSAALRSNLGRAEPVNDELQGLAAGTVLAATLRGVGLGFAPQRGGDERLRVALIALDPKAARTVETWPVGWPADDRRRELVPKLFEFLNVEIDGVSVGEAVDNIAPRLDVPVLYDRAALARHKVDVSNIDAAVPAKRTSYSLLLQKLLFQARLKYELRVDDGGRPFIWITTIKK